MSAKAPALTDLIREYGQLMHSAGMDENSDFYSSRLNGEAKVEEAKELLSAIESELRSLAASEVGEPVAWFVDANEHSTWTTKPDWFQVWPGDPMWSDNWKRIPLRVVTPPPVDSVEGAASERDALGHSVESTGSTLRSDSACGAASGTAE